MVVLEHISQRATAITPHKNVIGIAPRLPGARSVIWYIVVRICFHHGGISVIINDIPLDYHFLDSSETVTVWC